MSKQGKSISPVARAILAIVALVLIVVTGNLLVRALGLGNETIDLTENNVHSLSDGTEAILEDLAAPVTIRYYATRGSDYMPEDLKLHMRRVDELLEEYQSIAGDQKLRVENLDPEPDTDAEDSANLDGIRGQSINNENLYFGMAISCLDQTTTIPFLDPSDETMLEYRISRAIAEVSATQQPTIGVMSALDIGGGPGGMPGQPGAQPWVIYEELSKTYDVEDVGMNPESLSPSDYNVLLVLHPAEITPAAEFAIDQYVLQGGTVIAALDPFSITAQMTSGGGGNPMMRSQGTPTSSTFPTLLDAWGVEMSADQVVADSKYQTQMQGGRPGLAILTVPQEGMPLEDSIVTRELSSVTFLLAGGLRNTGGAGVSSSTLVKASDQSGLVDAQSASRLDPSLSTSFRPDNRSQALVMRLSGKFPSAFPDGDPSASQENDDSAAAEESAENAEENPGSTALTEASQAGNVFLISDVDAFYDQFAYAVRRLGNVQLAQPVNGNSSLLFNLVDQAASSTHLIGSRSRAATSRPFTVFQEMEAAADQEVGAKIEEYETQARQAQERLNQLQSQKASGDDLYLSPEQEQEIDNLRRQQVEARRQIRELQKDLRREKDAIAGRIIALNIAGVPLLVVLVGLSFYAARRKQTRAR